MNAIRSLAPAVLLALAPVAAAELRIVQPDGPVGTWPSIQEAIDAASDGDVILVKGGEYSTFYLSDKSLSIVAESGAFVVVAAGSRVVNLSAGKTVLLAGLELRGTAAPSPLFAGRGLTLINNQGAVRVQSCLVTGAAVPEDLDDCFGWNFNAGWPAIWAENCADVVLVDTTAIGGRGIEQVLGGPDCAEWVAGGNGGHGVQITNSAIAVYGGALIGGNGGNGGIGGDGSPALRASGGVVFLAGVDLYGGGGGQGWDGMFGWIGGDGGHGVFLNPTSPPAAAVIGLSIVLGGPAGPISGSVPGQPFVGALPTFLDGPARRIEFPVPAKANSGFTITLKSEPQDLGVVLVGLGNQYLPLPPFNGVLHTSDPVIGPLLALGSSGTATLHVQAPSLAPGAAFAVPLQAAFLSPNGSAHLGSVRHQVFVP